MKEICKRSTIALAAIFSFSIPAFAQYHPMPSSSAEPPVICTTCPSPYTGLPTYPYSSPIVNHTGRYVDSTVARSLQQPIRTLRAGNVKIAEDRDRVYMQIGSTFASYRLSTWFTEDLGDPMVTVNAGNRTPEKYLPWLASVYPEAGGSGWKTVNIDGQDRLGALFDYDDRGYVYLPYTVFGWGIMQDNGPQLKLIKQVGGPTSTQANPDPGADVTPFAVSVMKVGASYYAVIFSSTKGAVYDVTNPSAPEYKRHLDISVSWFAKATRNGESILGTVDRYGRILIFRAADLINGGNPSLTLNPGSGMKFGAITSDGTNFYTAEGGTGKGGNILILRPGSTAGSYQTSYYPMPGNNFAVETVSYGSDSLTVTGFDGVADNIRVFKLASGVPEEINFGNFFRSYYAGVDEQYAQAAYSTQVNAGVHFKWQGREYVVAAVNGLGDVYEIQGRDFVEVKLNTAAGWGTKNPSSARKDEGPFYGDLLRFTTASSGEPAIVSVNYGNPEAGTANTPNPVTTGATLSYRYSGLTSAAAIGATKKVRITDTNDASNFSEASVQMLVPVPRFGIANTSFLFTQPNASSTAPIVLGDQFVDASDGTLESHFATWTLDGVSTNTLPTGAFSVGQCGAHSLAFTARYGSYNTNNFAPNAASDYTTGISQFNYAVRPFVANFKVDPNSSTGSTVTFVSENRVSSSAVSGGGSASATFLWQLFDSGGAELDRKESVGPLNVPSSFTANKVDGSTVRLTVTLSDPAAIVDSSCAGQTVSASSVTLKIPDPVLTVQGCENVNGPCTITATSLSGQDQSGWKYTWFLDNAKQTGETSNTFSPKPTQPKSYTVRVQVVNEAGMDKESQPKSFQLAPALCDGKPSTIVVQYSGDDSGCTSNCTASEPINFKPYLYSGVQTYALQSCDTISWTFGDGATSTDLAPSHKYAQNGTYTTTVKLVNSETGPAGVTGSVTFTLGTTTPPPPPPPPGCSSPGSFFVAFKGANSGCSSIADNCNAGESITFTPSLYSLTGQFQSCDRFDWTFPDQSKSTQKTPSKSFQAGTHEIKLRVWNNAGERTESVTIKVTGSGGPTDPPPTGDCQAPGGFIGVNYAGATSGCSNTAGSSGCMPGETITLTATAWQYNFQDCDQFEWNFGDGSAVQTTETQTVSHVFQGGLPQYGVQLKVKNTAGSKDSNVTISFAESGVDKPTNVDFSFTNPLVGVPVTFQATANAPASHPVTVWNWTFSDGGTASGAEVQHTFTAEGAAWAELTAANAGGAAPTVRKNFTVAGANAFAFVIPVAAHSAGDAGSTWRTDIQIFNPGGLSEALELRFEFPATGHVQTVPIASSTKVYEDVLFELFGINTNAAGPIRISGAASHVPSIWSRTYNENSNGIGTYGQYIPAVRIDTTGNAETTQTRYYLTGLQSSPEYRTNIGWVNLTGSPLDLQITAYAEDGTALATVSKIAQPFQLNQQGMTALLPETADVGVVTVRIDGGRTGELIAYGSIVDNVSQDPVFISAIADVFMTDDKHSFQVVPGVGHLTNGNWRSDVDIFNPDGDKASLDLMFYDAAGNKIAEALGVPLEAKHTLHISDLTHSGQLTPIPSGDTLGVLKIKTTSALTERYPIVVDRTYSDRGASGTFGQGIAATPAAEPNVEAGKPAIIPGVRGDQDYYTNFGLVALSDTPTRVKVSLLSIESGAVQGSFEYDLDTDPSSPAPESLIDSGNGGSSCAERGVLRRLHGTASGGALKVEVLSGGPVWAYASMVDCQTSDPEYIPATPLN